MRPLAECLKCEWPHALGIDAKGPLLWKGEKCANWSEALRQLAKLKIAFRTQLKFDGLPNAFAARHLLSYPVTNHRNAAWGHEARLANQLRFKLLRDGNACRPLIFHLPCGLPAEMKNKLTSDDQRLVSSDNQLAVWRKVHRTLDAQNQLQRLA